MQRRNVASLPNNRTLSIHLKGQKYPKSRETKVYTLMRTRILLLSIEERVNVSIIELRK